MPRNPSVTRRPVRTPLRSSSAFVPTVVPWQKNTTSSERTPSARSASIPPRMARDGSSGVLGSFVIEIAPVSSSRQTKSENVPPVSTVTRYFPNVALPSYRLPRVTLHPDHAFSWRRWRPASGGSAGCVRSDWLEGFRKSFFVAGSELCDAPKLRQASLLSCPPAGPTTAHETCVCWAAVGTEVGNSLVQLARS